MSSVECDVVHCAECEERWCLAPEAIYHSAELKAKQYYPRALTDAVWCWDCEQPRYAERLPARSEFDNAAKVRARPEFRLPENVEDELLEIEAEDFEFLRLTLAGRSAPARCLWCGGSNFKALQVAVDLVVNLNHPYCDGRLYRNKWLFLGHSSNHRRKYRWLANDGKFLEPDVGFEPAGENEERT